LTRCGASKPQSWYWSCTALGALCCYRNASPSRVPVGLPHGFSFPASTLTLGPPLRLLVGLQAGIDHPRRPRTIPTWRYTVTARRGVAVGYARRGVAGASATWSISAAAWMASMATLSEDAGVRSADTSAMRAAAKVRAAASAAAGKRLGCSTDGSSSMCGCVCKLPDTSEHWGSRAITVHAQ
jgi:hypothetical protein